MPNSGKDKNIPTSQINAMTLTVAQIVTDFIRFFKGWHKS
jgi:hypothetical protein